MEARKMKNYFNANGTTYFLDSSIYIVDEEDLGNNLFLFQKKNCKFGQKIEEKKINQTLKIFYLYILRLQLSII